MNHPLEPARRGLSAAAQALDEYRRLSGAEAAPPLSSRRDPAETGLRAALDDARARLAELGGELDIVRRGGAEARAGLDAARAESAALAAAEAGARSEADAARKRAAEAASRASLLEAECVRLEKLRHAADAAAADAEAQGRDVAESLRREVRALHASLDRSAVAAGAADAQLRAMRARLESASASAALDEARARSAELAAELEKSRRLAAAQKAELESARGAVRSGADAAQRRAAETAARISRLEEECAHLEELRLAAERSAANAAARGRAALDAARARIAALEAERGPPPPPASPAP